MLSKTRVNINNDIPIISDYCSFQIAQFLLDFVFAGWGYLHHGFCVYGLIYGVIMTALFSNFYYHAYVMKRGVRCTKKNEMTEVSNGVKHKSS